MDWDILRFEYLSGIINDFEPEDLTWLNSGVLPEEPGKGGDEASWDIKNIRRDVSDFELAHAPASVRELQTIGYQRVKMATTSKSKPMIGDLWMNLREPGTMERQKLMESQLARELEDWAMLMARQDNFMISQALQGSLAMTVGGLPITIDYQVPQTNKFRLGVGAWTTIPVAWSNPSADIVTDLKNMKLAISRHSGRTAKRLWVSDLVMTYFLNNDSIQEFIGRTESGVKYLADGKIPRLMGLDILESNETYTDDAGTTVTPYLAENTVVMHPAPDKQWGSMMMGSHTVPTEDRRRLAEVFGKSSYSNIEVNPAALVLFAKYVRLPAIKLPAATVNAQVS